jgi:predicted YcjX-like family ATPase
MVPPQTIAMVVFAEGGRARDDATPYLMDSMLKIADRLDSNPAEEKKLALQFLRDAWEEAAYEGVDRDCLATAAIFAALSELISTYGEDAVAVMCERLPERVRGGEFTLARSRQ